MHILKGIVMANFNSQLDKSRIPSKGFTVLVDQYQLGNPTRVGFLYAGKTEN